jgi:hypothetical protein
MPKDISAKLAIKNQKVAEELKSIIASVEGFRLLGPNDMRVCDLLMPIPVISATHSGGKRPLVPIHSGRLFRSIPATHRSGATLG